MMRHSGLVILLALAAVAPAQTVAFEKDVLPILSKRCFSCHGNNDVKGDLRLDGRSWILKGSGAGEVVIPGDAEGSELYALTILPRNDPDIMPARGKPLTKAETEILRRWIEAGADFGPWKGTPGPGEVIGRGEAGRFARPGILRTYDRLAEGLEPLDAKELDALRALGVDARPVEAGHALLRVEFGPKVVAGDRKLRAKLERLSRHVTILDVARAPVDDRLLDWIAGLKQLTRLDLAHTEIGDQVFVKLKDLSELTSLNLFQTQITDAGLKKFPAWPALKKIHVYRTRVTMPALQALYAKRPGLRIIAGFVGPPPETEPSGNEGRRRR